jgi:acyl transferase domain-containing protein
LKRYVVAVENNESVYAKILGTGIGSDDSIEKAGYQVPSSRGQAEVVKSA